MSNQDDRGAGARAPLKPSHAKTAYDHLELPGGSTIGNLGNAEIATTLIALNVPGASHENGRASNAAHYGIFIERIRQQGADDAVAKWLASKRQ